jgi:hypothetical protein
MIPLGLYLILYAIQLQLILVKDEGITLREKRIKDLIHRKESILPFNEIQSITDEGQIIKITIKNKRIPFRIEKRHFASYELLLSKARELQIKIVD